MSGTLPRLVFTSRGDYARRFTSLPFWEPYVREVLRRHGLPDSAPATGMGGTFPTFLAGRYVVKFFPKRFEGGECFAIERSLHMGVLGSAGIEAPRYVAHGYLFPNAWRWPYLVTTRLDGTSWREAGLSDPAQTEVAAQLSVTLRRVHEQGCPPDPVWRRDLLGELRATCAERHRRWGTLPAHLVDQIDAYLAEPSTERRLVHGDLHADHVFVDGGRLVGIIDWGDALRADPYYDLPALFFGTFGGEKRLLRAFVQSYGWELTRDFIHRAMSMTLLHEFNQLHGQQHMFEGVCSLEIWQRCCGRCDSHWSVFRRRLMQAKPLPGEECADAQRAGEHTPGG